MNNPLVAHTQSFRERKGTNTGSNKGLPPRSFSFAARDKENVNLFNNNAIPEKTPSAQSVVPSMWRELPTSGDIPPGRSHTGVAVVGDFLYMVGGSRISATRALTSARRTALASTTSSKSLLSTHDTPARTREGSLPPLAPSPIVRQPSASSSRPEASMGASSSSTNRRHSLNGTSSIAAGQPPLADMYRLDLTTGVWTRMDVKGIPRVSHHTLTEVDGSLWLLGGWDGSRRSSRVHRFDLEQGCWEEIFPRGYIPCGLSSHSATKLDERRIYVVGREGGVRTQRRWTSYFEFDTVNRCWNELPSSISSRSGHSAAILQSGRLTIWGGRRSSDFDVQPVPSQGVPRVDCPALTLSRLKSTLGAETCPPPTGRTHQAMWASGPLMVFHGGQLLDLAISINKNLEDKMYAYDAEGKRWYCVPGGSGVVRTGANAFTHGKRLCLIGGEDYGGFSSRVMFVEL